MTYLLDTSVWFRVVTDPDTVPAEFQRLLQASDYPVKLSAISVWEVGKKHQIGKLKLATDLVTWFATALPSSVEIIPITPDIVAQAMALKDFPNRDPADELVVATARVHDLTLLTTDTAIKNYPHARVRYFTPILRK